jgi:hypothetical protein
MKFEIDHLRAKLVEVKLKNEALQRKVETLEVKLSLIDGKTKYKFV